MTKYKARKVELDGYKFDSIAEANHYKYIILPMLQAGKIQNLVVHPKFPCTYIADFEFELEGDEVTCKVVQDVKGMKTPTYRLKKKLVEALYPGVTIEEIPVGRSAYLVKG